MAKPFPDMDYWGAFMAMGPVPLGDASRPAGLRPAPAVHRPLQDRVVPARTRSSSLVKNDQWDPDTDPARHQYADGYVFKFNQDQAQVDEIMLSGNTDVADRRSPTALGSDNYTRANSDAR